MSVTSPALRPPAAVSPFGAEPWRSREALQQPHWDDPAALEDVLAGLRLAPGLVTAEECDDLTRRLGAVARGEAFLLQGGDCAETFAGSTTAAVAAKVRTLLAMAVVLQYGALVPVVKVGRLAGQYGKPRSSPTESRDGVTLPSYRGDIVNDIEFDADARRPDPARLRRAYDTAAATLNLVRALAGSGEADLSRVHDWNRDFARGAVLDADAAGSAVRGAAAERYDRMAGEIDRALAFMRSCGVDLGEARGVNFFASHEALVLDYEAALTRPDDRPGRGPTQDYDLSGHMVWVGERTRDPEGAHIAFAAGLANPVAVKLGPTTTPADALRLAAELNPHNVPGRLSFITRMGAGKVRSLLPALVDAVRDAGLHVVWICDPMHGNTYATPTGHKTRHFDAVLDEVRGFFEVHRALGTWPGGIHVELTGDDVTECVGGAGDLSDADLGLRYETACDPRLNREQSLELAFQVAEMLADGRRA